MRPRTVPFRPPLRAGVVARWSVGGVGEGLLVGLAAAGGGFFLAMAVCLALGGAAQFAGYVLGVRWTLPAPAVGVLGPLAILVSETVTFWIVLRDAAQRRRPDRFWGSAAVAFLVGAFFASYAIGELQGAVAPAAPFAAPPPAPGPVGVPVLPR